MEERITPCDAEKQHQTGWSLHGKVKIADLVFEKANQPWYVFKIVWHQRPQDIPVFFDKLRGLFGEKDHYIYEELFLIGEDEMKVSFDKIIVSGDENILFMRDFRANSRDDGFYEFFFGYFQRFLTRLRRWRSRRVSKPVRFQNSSEPDSGPKPEQN